MRVTSLGCSLLLVLQAQTVLLRAQVDPVTLWQELANFSLDPAQTARVDNVSLKRDVATLTLIDGQLALNRRVPAIGLPAGRVIGAAFMGTGRFRFTPTLPIEKQQLALHSGQEALDEEFTEAVFSFSDRTAEELAELVDFGAGEVGRLQRIVSDRFEYLASITGAPHALFLTVLLSDNPERHQSFICQLRTRRHGWLTLTISGDVAEGIALGQLEPGREPGRLWASLPALDRTPQEAYLDPWPGQNYAIRGYALDVTAEENTDLTGIAEVEVEMIRSGERVLLFALDPHLRLTEVTDEQNRPLVFFQASDPGSSSPRSSYVTVVSREPLPRSVQRIRFRYSGKELIRKLGSGNFFCQSGGWYPGYFSSPVSTHYYDFELTLRVPKKFEAVAVGTKVEEREEEHYRLTRWRSDIPIPNAGFAFGSYRIEKRTAGKATVEVYANRNPDDYLRAIELAAQGVTPRAIGGRATLGSLSPSRLAGRMADEVAASLEILEGYFGAYPYKKLAVCNIPYAYGQGWPSLLYLSVYTFLDSSQRHQLGLRDHTGMTHAFRAHEIAHQWWGNSVGWQSYHDQWLSEGFAEYSGMLYTLYRSGGEEYLRLLRDARTRLLRKDEGGVRYADLGPLYLGSRLSSPDHPDGYDVVTYSKGAWILHMLRMMLFSPFEREDPDALFKAMMQDFTRTFSNRPASTEDFKATVERHLLPAMDLDNDRGMDWFFDSWVYGTGIPSYELRYSIEPGSKPGIFVASGTLIQSDVPSGFRTVVPVYLHQGDRHMRAGWLHANSARTPFRFTLEFKPDKISVNAEEDILAVNHGGQ